MSENVVANGADVSVNIVARPTPIIFEFVERLTNTCVMVPLLVQAKSILPPIPVFAVADGDVTVGNNVALATDEFVELFGLGSVLVAVA